MPIALITFMIYIALLLFSLFFKLSGKLRLTIPLIYLVLAIISTFFTRWTTENEPLVLTGLYILIGLSILSWIYSLIKFIFNKQTISKHNKAMNNDITWQIQRARELGFTNDQITFNSHGDMLDPYTGEPFNFAQHR